MNTKPHLLNRKRVQNTNWTKVNQNTNWTKVIKMAGLLWR